jgi:DNA-3-methyladenine glycosylase II
MHYIEHLSKDKKFQPLLQGEPIELKKRKVVYMSLIGSIMSQQLSTKVAHVIHNRFMDLFGGKVPTPEQIMTTPVETLRSIGLSNAKASYVHNVAQFAAEQGMEKKKLDKMSNEEVIAYLTQIKGVGKWTTEMILMFTLGREDVFAIDDWGVQSAMIKIYKLKTDDKKKLRERLLKISSKWSPYRTYACMHLWAWKDNPPAVE